MGHDPWKRYRLHPDHRNAGFLVTDGIVAARDPLFFPELGDPPHRPTTLLLFEADEPDHLEDVTGFVEAKLAALLEHRSQLRSTMGIARRRSTRGSASTPRSLNSDAMSPTRLAEQGEKGGFAAAEAFKRIDKL